MKTKIHPACVLVPLFLCTGVQASPEVTVSGHINRAILALDDGEGAETYFVDNKNSASRFRIVASDRIHDGLRAGARFEMGYESNPSSSISRTRPSVSAELKERRAELFISGGFGAVYLGQGDGAANGLTHVDLSGTNMVSLLGHAHLMGGSFTFFEQGNAGPTLSDVMANFDFESRYDRIAYHSTGPGPLTLRASVGRKDDMVYEASALYSARADFAKVSVGVGYSSEKVPGADDNETLGGSASVLLDNGLNGAISYSRLDTDASRSATNTTFRLGYRAGKHASSVDYGITDDLNRRGDRATYVGANYVYKPLDWLEVFGAVRRFELDRRHASYDDMAMVVTGSRIKF
ncbi:porin [Alloalcanivorax sp. C16-2]|uniref:porin n=1 Tax=Alloalcanivorax sp. C16-2 TaxID=3390052 RepID=UPI003970A808